MDVWMKVELSMDVVAVVVDLFVTNLSDVVASVLLVYLVSAAVVNLLFCLYRRLMFSVHIQERMLMYQ